MFIIGLFVGIVVSNAALVGIVWYYRKDIAAVVSGVKTVQGAVGKIPFLNK